MVGYSKEFKKQQKTVGKTINKLMLLIAKKKSQTHSFLQNGFDSKAETKSIMNEFLKMRHLVRFNGFQEIYDKLFPMFTDKKSGSTFVVKKGDKLYDTWKLVQEKFAK